MKRTSRLLLLPLVSLFTVAGLAGGCSSADLPHANLGGNDSGAGGDGSTTGKDGGPGGDDGGGGGKDGATGDDGGPTSVTIVDVPNLPCAKPGGTSVELTAATGTSPTFDRMGSVGTSRFAWSTGGGGLITFHDDSTNVSTPVDGVASAGGEPSAIVSLVASSGGLVLQRYHFDGSTSGSSTPLANPVPVGAVIAGGPSKSLALWKDGVDVVGKMIDAGGGVAGSVSLGTGSGGAAGAFAASAAWTGSDFAVVWSRKRTDGKTETSFAKVSTAGAVSGTRSVFVDAGHSVVQLAKKTTGFGLLLNEGQPATGLYVVRLDDQGKSASTILHLLGGKYGLGLAANGNDVAAVGVLSDGRGVFASFDDSGTPLGRWMCVDDSAGGVSFDAQVAIDTSDTGFALLSHRVNGSTALLHVDHVGIGL